MKFPIPFSLLPLSCPQKSTSSEHPREVQIKLNLWLQEVTSERHQAAPQEAWSNQLQAM